MKIISPGIKEGLLYQRTEMPLFGLKGRKERYEILLQEPEDRKLIEERIVRGECSYRKLERWNDHIKYLRDTFEEDCCGRHDWRVKCTPSTDDLGRIDLIVSEDLEKVIDQAAAVFARDALIKTLDRPALSEYFMRNGKVIGYEIPRHRNYPVPEGVLQYFRKEIRKRRQKLIGEID